MKKFLTALIVLSVLYTILNSIHLHADAPQGISISQGPYTDEGFKTYAARNKALFGKWIVNKNQTPGWLFESPVNTLLYYINFKFFGVGLSQARVLSILYGLLSGIFLALISLKIYKKQEAGILTALLWFLNFNVLTFFRIALVTQGMVFFIILGLYFIIKTEEKEGKLYYLLAGLCMGLSYFCASLGAIVILGFFLSIYLNHSRKSTLNKSAMKSLLLFIGGGLISIVLFILYLFYIGQGFEIVNAGAKANGLSNLTIKDLIINLITFTEGPFFLPLLFIFLFGIIGTIQLLFNCINRKEKSVGKLAILLWAIMIIGFFSVYRYRAGRFMIILIPPLILSAVGFVSSTFKFSGIKNSFADCPPYLKSLFIILLLWTCYTFSFIILSAIIDFRIIISSAFMGIILFIITLRFIYKSKIIISTRAMSLILVCYTIGFTGFYYTKWHLSPTYITYNLGNELKNILPEDAIIVGDINPSSGLEHKCYIGINRNVYYRNSRDIRSEMGYILSLEKGFAITHLLLSESVYNKLNELYPGRYQLLKSFDMFKGKAMLVVRKK